MTRSQGVAVEALEFRTLLAVQLVADVDPVTPSTSPENTVAAGGTAFFTRGNELWKTDGTVAGSSRVAALPLVGTYASPNGVLVAVPGSGIVVCLTYGSDRLWTITRSDGTAAGTFPLTQGVANPGALVHFYASGSSVYWHATYYDPNNAAATRSAGLWASDGTVAGTRQVADFTSGPAFEPTATTFANGNFYFLVSDGTSETLWKSDGTAAGTAAMTNVGPYVRPSSSLLAPRLVQSGGRFFATLSAGPSYGLYTSTGTASGTSFLRYLGTEGGDLVALNGKAYFRDRQSGQGGYELWTSDGTAAGTIRLIDLLPGAGSGMPGGLTPVGNLFYFSARGVDGGSYDQVWKSDGTATGTTLLKSVSNGSAPIGTFTGAAGGKVFFFGNSRLWRTDGTPAGTTDVTVTDVSFGARLAPFGAGVLVHGADRIRGTELWYTDGSPASTRAIDLTTNTYGAGFGDPVDFNGAVHFLASPDYTPGGNGLPALMKTDGTAAGTTQIKYGILTTSPIVRSGNRLYFAAFDGESGAELFSSDGTAAGTGLLKDLNTYPRAGSNPSHLTDFNGTLYFLANDFGATGRFLWRSDGTDAGTVHVSDTLKFSNSPQPYDLLKVAGNTLYIVATDAAAGLELFRLNEAGVPVLVKDLRPGPESSLPVVVGELNGRLIFSASADGGWYRQLWSTDGTEAGTIQLSDTAVGRGPMDSGFRLFRTAVLNNELYFYGGYESEDAGLWKTDGTPAGTTLVSRQPLGVNKLAAAGGKLFFSGGGYPAREETLYVSDGTAGGTRALRRFARTGEDYVTHAGRVFFTATHPAYGRELWSTDGTPEGTVMDADLNPGAADGVFNVFHSDLGPPGGMLLFAGATPEYGEEPRKWVPGVVPAPAAVVQRLTFYNDSAADGLNESADARDDLAVANDVAALRPGESSTCHNRTNFSRGLNGILIDVANLPAGTTPTASDFVVRAGVAGDASAWPLTVTPQVSVRRGAGAYSTDRVSLTWKDGAAPKNAWVQVTVKANAHTGLASPDVFYFGNLIGDVSRSLSDPMAVDLRDFATVRSSMDSAFRLDEWDLNRDGRINVVDLAFVRANLGRRLPDLSAAAVAKSARAAVAAAPPAPRRALRVRRTWYESDGTVT